MRVAQKSVPIVQIDFQDLPPQDKILLVFARAALEEAYNPYSGFSVGAAVLTRTKGIITGANVENAAYGEAICAERSALVRANAQGVGHMCVAIAVVARNRNEPTTEITAPCGACRQVIKEFAERSGMGEEFRVILATTDFSNIVVATLGDLLPLSFGPKDLT